jgi:two-component system, LytTR family, response regulator
VVSVLRVAIVDDEAPARAALRILLAERPDVEVAAECSNGADAVDVIRRIPLDLVLLDVQMPGLDGLEVVRTVGPGEMPPTVFVTAHDAYAVRAFDVQAVDYVLKPFDKERFHAALDRAVRRIAERRSADWAHRVRELIGPVPAASGSPGVGRLPVSLGDRVTFVEVSEIDWIAAAGQKVMLHVGPREYCLRQTLQALLAALPRRDFVQIHRSHAVNLSRVKELLRMGKGDAQVVLTSGVQLRLSRRYREQLRNELGWPI